MTPKTVGELEKALFDAFPLEDAESWDSVGLVAGNRSTPLEKIALNLDMSVDAVIEASEAGCSTLVTHHPPFIKDAPCEYGPASQVQTPGPGRAVFEAISRGVNLINMHTNADRAIATRERFAQLLDMKCAGNCESALDGTRELQETGLGSLLEPMNNEAIELFELARRCKDVFGGSPRVWGDAASKLKRIAFLNGSWRDAGLYGKCIEADIDCVIVGETGYHLCLDAQPYVAIIELGHDLSELPIVDVLNAALSNTGIADENIVRLHCSDANWWVA